LHPSAYVLFNPIDQVPAFFFLSPRFTSRSVLFYAPSVAKEYGGMALEARHREWPAMILFVFAQRAPEDSSAMITQLATEMSSQALKAVLSNLWSPA
jgi:hypothetical protein